MSTYYYLECVTHEPPIRSDLEVEQRVTSFLDDIRGIVRAREIPDEIVYPFMVVNGRVQPYDIHDFWRAVAIQFVAQHPQCRIELVTEYGDREGLA